MVPRSRDLSPLDFFFQSILKEKAYSMKITDLNRFRQHITSHWVEIDANADLFHQVHLNFQSASKYPLTMMDSMLKILFNDITSD